MNGTILFLMALAIGALLSAACVTGASDSELESACENLEKIRTGQPADEADQRLAKCKQDLSRERLSQKAVQCRTKATDLDTFWNRCR